MLLVIFKGMIGAFRCFGEGLTGKSLEVEQAGVAPFHGVLLLNGQARVHLLPSFRVDGRPEGGPAALHPADRVYAGIVLPAEFRPKGAAGVHPVSFSCGIALVGPDGLDRGLADADGALFRAKQQGPGSILTA